MTKIKETLKNNCNILGLLCIFIIIQPFLDINILFTNKDLEIFGFTIPTIIRCLFLLFFSLWILKNIHNKKHIIFLILYFILVIIYTLFHNKIVSDNIIIPSSYSYSLISEIFYIIRMFFPISIIYFTKNMDISFNKFLKVLVISGLIISLIIFIGNTFCISYTSYETEYNHTVVNWISWFTGESKNYEFNELTSKGWFFMANQVSGLMIFLVPFIFYNLIKKPNIFNTISSLIFIISMIMLGTRVASYGFLIVGISIILIILYLRYFKNEKWWNFKRIIPFITVLIIGTIFLIVSPISSRKYGYELGDMSKLTEKPSDLSKNEEVINYVIDNYELFGIQKRYIDNLYPVKFDSMFWIDIFNYSLANGVIENREMQTLICKRIDELNNHLLKYKLFGYSFSRMRNGGIYMEHDFIAQAFSMGYLGMILILLPYILIIFKVGIKIISKLKEQPKLIDFIFILSIFLVLFTSILSGHILDELFVMIYIGFTCGFFWKRVNYKEVVIREREYN